MSNNFERLVQVIGFDDATLFKLPCFQCVHSNENLNVSSQMSNISEREAL